MRQPQTHDTELGQGPLGGRALLRPTNLLDKSFFGLFQRGAEGKSRAALSLGEVRGGICFAS